jgi:hypothetical protein
LRIPAGQQQATVHSLGSGGIIIQDNNGGTSHRSLSVENNSTALRLQTETALQPPHPPATSLPSWLLPRSLLCFFSNFFNFFQSKKKFAMIEI